MDRSEAQTICFLVQNRIIMAKKPSMWVAAFFRSFFDEFHLFSYTNVDFLHKIIIILIEKIQKVFFFLSFSRWVVEGFFGVSPRFGAFSVV